MPPWVLALCGGNNENRATFYISNITHFRLSSGRHMRPWRANFFNNLQSLNLFKFALVLSYMLDAFEGGTNLECLVN